MESCNRTQPTGRLWAYLAAAAIGTLLLAFVPSDAWLKGAAQPETAILAIHTKQLLTVLLLMIVPSLWARVTHLVSPWLLLGLTGLAYAAGFFVTRDPVGALYAAVLIALPGVGLYGLQRLKLSNFRTVIYESLVILAALFGFVCLKDLIRTGNAYKSYQSLVDMYDTVLERIPWAALYGEQVREEMTAMIDLFRTNAESYCAPILLLPSMAAALSGTLFSHLFNRDGGAALVPLPRFSEWRCERWYVLLTGGVMLATLFLSMAGVQWAIGLSGIVGILWRMPCMLGGLCTVRRLGLKTGRKWVFWVAIGMLIVLPPATGMLLSLLGLLSAMKRPTNVGEDGERK